MHEPMLCEEALDRIEPFLDGELTSDDAARLRDHLAGCRSCAGEMALAVKIQRELRALAPARQGEVVPFPRLAGRGASMRIFLAAAVLALTVGGALFLAQIRIRPASLDQTAESPDPAKIALATAEARFALAYIGKVSRQTGLDLRDGILRRRMPLTSEP
jgi:anti-sigma factor (TIGR02949 family)